jgi:hypothetical protein
MGYSAIYSTNHRTSSHIFSVGDWFKVIWIHAAPHTAKMI